MKVVMRILKIKFVRFATVGVSNGLIYGAATAFYVSSLGIEYKVASALGYLTALPYAFFAHRAYTFSSRGLLHQEMLRFFVTHATSLTVSVVAMGVAVDQLGMHHAIGILGAIVLVPIVTFIVLDNWVFADKIADKEEGKNV